MKTFKELRQLINEANKSVVVDFDMGDPMDYASEWEAEGIFVVNWDKRKNKLTVGGHPNDLNNWLTGTYGMGRGDARKAMSKARPVK